MENVRARRRTRTQVNNAVDGPSERKAHTATHAIPGTCYVCLRNGMVVLVLAALALVAHMDTWHAAWQTGGFPKLLQKPLLPLSDLEVVAKLPSPPGNLAVSASGRVFFTFHPEYHFGLKVCEYREGTVIPFPSAEAQHTLIKEVLSIRWHSGCVWVADTGVHAIFGARVYAISDSTHEVLWSHSLPRSVCGVGCNLNDFQILSGPSEDGWPSHIFIADSATISNYPGLIIIDVAANSSRRVLANHPSVRHDGPYAVSADGQAIRFLGFLPIKIHVDSIALSRDGQWLYYAAIADTHLHRIRTSVLLDHSLSAPHVAAAVERWATKPQTDGITTDTVGNVYLTAFEHSSVQMLDAQGRLHTLFHDPNQSLLRWPDGFSFGPDGFLYFTCSALQQIFGGGRQPYDFQAPFHILRFRTEHSDTAAGQ